MKFYRYNVSGNTYTRPFITEKRAKRYARFLVNKMQSDVVYQPTDGSHVNNTVHYMIACPTCKGKGKTGNPEYGEENMKVCTQCGGKKKLMASQI